MRDLFEHFLAQKRTEDGSSLGGARGAEPTALAAHGYQKLGLALGTLDAGETSLEISTILEGVHRVFDECTPESVGPFELLIPDSLDLLVGTLYQAKYR